MAFSGLSQKIKQQYNQAIKNGTVLFTDSEVIELDDEQTQIPVSSLLSLSTSFFVLTSSVTVRGEICASTREEANEIRRREAR
jgi:hypothetical protein